MPARTLHKLRMQALTGFYLMIYLNSASCLVPGTMFLTGLVDLRKAKIALKSWSVICRIFCHGIGGNKGLLPSSPLNLPSRIALKKCASLQFPSPVSSEVRFAAKDTPHGPAAEVRSSLNITIPFLITLLSYLGTILLAGKPDSLCSISISGPWGPNFLGE